MAVPPKKRIGELLVEAGVIDEHQLRAALGHQRQWGGKLGQTLVDLKLATETQIVSALSRKLGFEIVDLDALQLTPALDAALKLVPGAVARRSNLVPLAADTSSVTVAMSDPTNLAVTDEIAFRLGRRVKIVLAGDREVSRAVLRFYFPDEQIREGEALELDTSGPLTVALNNAHEALPDHVQKQFYTAPRGLGETTVVPARIAAAVPAPPAAPRPAPPAAAPAAAAPAPPLPGAPVPEPSTASREAALRDALDRLAAGEEAPSGLKASRLVAALTKVLLRRGLVTEAELVAELTRR